MKCGWIKGNDKKIARLLQGTIILNPAGREAGFALLDAAFEKGCNTFAGTTALRRYGERLWGQ